MVPGLCPTGKREQCFAFVIVPPGAYTIGTAPGNTVPSTDPARLAKEAVWRKLS